MSINHELVIRYLPIADGAVERLAKLDSARPPTGPVLVAERAGVPIAARALGDAAIVADPFVPTADAVALLDMRARQLDASGRRSDGFFARLASPVALRRRPRAS